MIEPIEELSWPGQYLGRRVLIYDSVPSTNDLAAVCQEPGTVFITREQTAGRGQHGRVWHSLPDTSLLLSITLNPPATMRRPVLLTAWAAVAIAESIYQLSGCHARLKWPNDLFINGKKVCGILIEQKQQLVLGLGLNLMQTAEDFARAELPLATSLLAESGRVVSPLTAAQAVIHHLDTLCSSCLDNAFEALQAEWQSRIGLLDRPVSVELLDGTHQPGYLQTLTFENVVLLQSNGVRLELLPESIRHISAS
jgi:BirA family transcriptional regulator, biotin operon repressor / biotin---[acetyl-CoA-carboxylase] ligase